MKRQKLLGLLSDYPYRSPDEEECRQRCLAFVKGNANCFESMHPPKKGQENSHEMGHITGSAWVLSPDGQSVLLTHHKKLNKWLQLGGHSDGEHDVLQTALREAREESGIDEIRPLSEKIFDIDIHTFPKKKNIEAHLHYDIRFLLQAPSEKYRVSEESHNLKWISLKEITSELFEDSLVRMAQKTNRERVEM